ncbi:MAG: hypothetical protein HKN13_07165 [Rhodothermales bacterium]|nr:hypothetical protein [Rhodothermales bacterium]
MYYKPSFLKANAQLFVQVRNLLDTVQEVNVYSDTGRADESVQLELFRRSGTAVGGLNTLDEFFYQQGNFGAPRRINLGINYRF